MFPQLKGGRMPMFSFIQHFARIFVRRNSVAIVIGTVFCAFLISDVVFSQGRTQARFAEPSQSEISIGDQSSRMLSPQEQLHYQQQLAQNTQQSSPQNASNADTARQISRMFGPGASNSNTTNSTAQTTGALNQQNYIIPEEERRKGVVSLESHQRLQEKDNAPQSTFAATPSPSTQNNSQVSPTTNQTISQPRYAPENWTPVSQPTIQQVAGRISDEGASNAALELPVTSQDAPPLASPREQISELQPGQPPAQIADQPSEVQPEPPIQDLALRPSILIDATERPTQPAETIPQLTTVAYHNSTDTEKPAQNAMLPRIDTASSHTLGFGETQNGVSTENADDENNPESESTYTKYSDRPMPALPAKGEQKADADEKKGSGPFGLLPKSTPPILTVLSSLAIVLGVFFILVWLMKRATPRQAGVLPQEVFEKLGSVPLSPKMHMHLFRLGGKLVLVSVTPDGMEPVAEVTDPDEVVHLIGLCKQNDPKSSTAAFRQVLKQYTGEKGQQQQRQMTGNYPQQPMPQQYPQQQMQQPMQQYPPQNMQQTVRRPVGVVSPAKAYQR